MANNRRAAVPFKVKIDGQWALDMQVVEVEHAHGGTRLDFARISRDYGRHTARGDGAPQKDRHLRDYVLGSRFDAQSASTGKICEVYKIVGGRLLQVHWGKLQREEVSISIDGESHELVSRADNTHFGNPIGFQRVQAQFRPNSYIDQEIVFNPDVEDVIVGNCRRNPSGLTYPIFVHPESIRTANAANFQQSTALEFILGQSGSNEQAAINWTLVDAVLYLCNECNGAQKVFKNPTRLELEGVLPGTRSLLKNQPIKPGMYLPAALDSLLQPFGFSWVVDYELNRTIRVFKRGASPLAPVQFKYTQPGTVFDPEKHDIERMHMDFDLATAVNQVKVVGGETQIEGSFELIPGWETQYDTLDEENTISDADDWEERPQHHRVRRTWVLNEGADYTRGTPYDLTAAFRAAFTDHPVVAIRRRKFLPCLTRDHDGVDPAGEHSGIVVEWWNPEKDDGAGWEILDKSDPLFSYRVLQKECGITFNGQIPPDYLYNDGISSAKIRVTAVIESDSRINYTAKRTADTISPELREEVVDRKHSFHCRKLVPPAQSGVVPTSKYFFEVTDNQRKALQLDGREAMKQYAEALRLAWDQADLSGTLTLDGCDYTDAAIGRVVNKIKGREIYLRLNRDSQNPRYPQIVGVRYFPQLQATHIILESFRETDEYLGRLLKFDRRQRNERE